MALLHKKRSFFERLTGSIRMEDDEPVEVPAKKRGLAARFDSDYEDENSAESSVELVATEDDAPTEAQLAIDMYETDREVVVKTMTAGVKKEDLQISVSREQLTVRGRRSNEPHAYQHHYHNQELYWGAFSRTVDLPDEIDIEQASATEHHGLVTIRLPKFDKKKQATLKVQ